MSSITSFNQFSYTIKSKTFQHPQFGTKVSNSAVNFTDFGLKKPLQSSISIKESSKKRPGFVVLVAAGDDYGPEEEAAGVAVAEEEPPKEPTEIDILKKRLVDSFYGTDRGLSASSETRAEVVELITQLEAKNPTPAPTEALTLLNGKWILAYTSFIGLFPLLSRGTLPLVKVEEISQTIDSEAFTVENVVQFAGPLATTSITTNAKFEVRSPKRVQIKFEEGVIGTPQLTDSIELPESVELLGQKIDLNPVKGLLTSVQDTASSVAKSISSRPPLKFSLSNRNAESWLLTTYLDDELRISRGDGGSIFVLIKEGSPLLKP
ncbi:light-induced protein, chloroplastic-like [Coffea eugenioides]|uniref:Light-induced protein, chloroplastic n=1 Tax=Coffea arabica TaxID=13443 RepID=A0A6P6UIS2_COFAR|nr:light-induced protein, chloroplastic-like [Coffea arabica]XP_027168926.1 light-induced protein, chloroplastic-like [Coffea eugenioides]XP_027185642.1 light-induced protein, chloroplastic-like [Coffea eugenioides]